MEIKAVTCADWKLLFVERPALKVFRWMSRTCRFEVVDWCRDSQYFWIRSHELDVYAKTSTFGTQFGLVLLWILDTKEYAIGFGNLAWLERNLKVHRTYQANKGEASMIDVGEGKCGIVPQDWDRDFRIATIDEVQQYGYVDAGADEIRQTGTNVCTKCGYINEYMEPVVGYVCRQCKMRLEMWA